jgi:hypothetical protein
MTSVNQQEQIRPKKPTGKTRRFSRGECSESTLLAGMDRPMNRPLLTRAVFFELRRALRDAFSAGELLRLAASLVAAYKLDWEDKDYGGYVSRDPFRAAAVDKAMMDGGWKILDFEHRSGMPMSDDTPEDHLAVEARIKGFVGRAEWPRIGMAWL